ncbi:MAG TPA: T9SS type A sorting domain-containing protein [Ignavibacteriaceae bacterium]|nr:T9SS type A sorting domain-containing protein [Ignavibacteriaceae bacterium]
MKRLILFFFCLLGFNLYSQSIYWEQAGLNNISIRDIEFVKSTGTLYACSNYKIYSSTNRGITWDTINVVNLDTFNNAPCKSIAVDNEKIIYVQSLGFLQKSTNNGSTWINIGANIAGEREFSSVHTLPNNNVLAGALGRMYHSTNKGTSWTSTNYYGAFSGYIKDKDGILFADIAGKSGCLSCGPIRKSLDTGKTWINIPQPYSSYMNTIGVFSDSVLVGMVIDFLTKGIYLSYDQGSTWQIIDSSSYQYYLQNVILFNDDKNHLFLIDKGISDNQLMISSDTGKTFTYANFTGYIAKIIYDDFNTIYLATGAGIYRTNYFATPVELISFNAVVTDGIELNWSTASETNNKGFEVQRSYDNSNFISIGFVNGAGTSSENKSYSFVDKSLKPGTYFYRLKQIDFDGSYKYHKTITVNYIDKNIPDEFILYQNYPNPFNPSTKIKYFINQDAQVELKLLTPMGEENLLEKGLKSAGEYEYIFDGSKLSSGIYFMKVIVGNESKIIKMILMK